MYGLMLVRRTAQLIEKIVFRYRSTSGEINKESGVTKQQKPQHPLSASGGTASITTENSQNGLFGRLKTTSLRRSNRNSR